jgi:nucleotide-binding universal stress UspA family protein
MSCQDILVVIDTPATVVPRLAVAALVARRCGARVNGLYATGYPLVFTSGDIVGSTALIEAFMAAQQAEAVKAESAFRAELARLQLAGEWLFREAEATQAVIALARLHDLVVLGQPDPDSGSGGLAAQPEEVVLATGRPVLMVPYAGSFAELGRHVVVAWNGTREAARALHDALFLLAQAEQVTVIEIDPQDSDAGLDDLGAEAVAAMLQRRGIAATSESTVSDGVPVADVILSRAADLGADLLVMGAWGHSRLREFVLGGVSRGLFREMTLPVLMAH